MAMGIPLLGPDPNFGNESTEAPTPEQAEAIENVEDALKAVYKDPKNKQARITYDDAVTDYLQVTRDKPAVKDFFKRVIKEKPVQQQTAASGYDESYTVTGDRDYLIGSTVDNAAIYIGEKKEQIAASISGFLQENPGAAIALQVADIGMSIIAPGKTVAGYLLDKAKGKISGWVSSKMEGPRLWSKEKADLGGEGYVTSASILLNGLAAITAAAGGISIKNGINRVPSFGDYPNISTKLSQRQGRHIVTDNDYTQGGYFNDITDAQAVLDAWHRQDVQIIGRHNNGPVIKYNGVTGYNHNKGAGYLNQPTNLFHIKGDNPSIVPMQPNWKPK
jgi:hypothetical protein